MLAIFYYMDSVTAVNELMEPACTFAPHTVTTRNLVNFEGCTTKKIDHTKIGALCSYIVVQAVQEGHACPQHNNNESYLWTYSSIVLTWIQGPPTKWKTFLSNTVALIQEETASA